MLNVASTTDNTVIYYSYRYRQSYSAVFFNFMNATVSVTITYLL